MPESIPSRALRDRLREYLLRVRDGERVVVLWRGKPVAALVPVGDLERLEAAEAEIRRLREALIPFAAAWRPTMERMIVASGDALYLYEDEGGKGGGSAVINRSDLKRAHEALDPRR